MTAGDAAHWDDLFSEELLPLVFALVLDAWDRFRKPAPDEPEDTTSTRLYAAMVTSKDRQRHPFLIRLQDLEVDAELAEVIGRKDIVFFPSNDEDIYFCLEAKRLNALVSGRRRSLADEYVKSGMLRFVKGKCSRRVRHGGMLGYVLDGRVDRAMKNVANVIRIHHATLGMTPPGELHPSGVRPSDRRARETHHVRKEESVIFRIHHLFVATPQRIGRAG